MELFKIAQRAPVPEPWAGTPTLPWHDPDFSRRMLAEQLAQDNDAASRRFAIIDEHGVWLHRAILGERPSRVLDLGCGPGFYTTRLARLGHECVGIDIAPAALAHARAESVGLGCSYITGDIRTVAYGVGYDLVMLIYGEFNSFAPEEAQALLTKARAALTPGGALLLEVYTPDAVRAIGAEPTRWASARSSAFCAEPHLLLSESFWSSTQQAATRRIFVVEAATGCVQAYAQSFRAYGWAELDLLLTEAGFVDPLLYPSLSGRPLPTQRDYAVVVARTPA